MSVRIRLEDGREILVTDGIDAVRRAYESAVAAGNAIEITTPEGTIYVNPAQVVSFEPLDSGTSSK